MQTNLSQSQTQRPSLRAEIHQNENYVTRLAVTNNDRHAVFALRHRVYVQEMKLLQLFKDCKSEITDHWDVGADLIATFTASGECVGTSRLNYGTDASHLPYPEMMKYNEFKIEAGETYCYASRTMVDSAHRKGGLAFYSMMKEFCQLMKERRVRYAFLYCQPHLIPSFSAMGFKAYQSPISHEEIGEVVPMVLDLKNIAYLREIRAVTYRYLARIVN